MYSVARRVEAMNEFVWIDELVNCLGFWRSERRPWTPPSEADVREVERIVGGALPVEYAYFVSQYGGGSLGNDDFQVSVPVVEASPWGKSTSPEGFYPILPSHPDSLDKEIATFKGRIPRGVIPMSRDAGGNQICLDVVGTFPGSVWFWDHEQRWFKGNIQETSEELEAAGIDANRLSVHGILREWARRHPDRFDRPADYMGMYRIAPSFSDFLRALYQVPY
jgi:hypothetical protein